MKNFKSKEKPFVVPIIFSLRDYDDEFPLYSWIYEVYFNFVTRNNSALIAQENYLKQDINLLDKTYSKNIVNSQGSKDILNKKKKDFQKYSISNKETEKILLDKKDRCKSELKLISKKNLYYESIVEEKITTIERDYNKKIDVLMTWVWNPSLESIAKKRGYKLISLELSPIRNILTNHNYSNTLCYFQFVDKYNKSYCKKSYNNFLKEDKEGIPQIFSRQELLSLFLNTEDLVLLKEIKKTPKYELGLSPGFQNDPFYTKHSSIKIQDTCKKINKLFNSTRVSIRHHPNLEYSVGNLKWDKDKSKKSLYWVAKCKRIVSSVSNIAFDAMLLGRTSYVLSDNMPFSFKSLNRLDWADESVVDSLYLNFMVFAYFTPWDLIFNSEYLEWRLTQPNIIDIYKYNRKHILESLGLKGFKSRITQKDILQMVHKLKEEEINDLIEYDPYRERKMLEGEKKALGKSITRMNYNLKNLNQELKKTKQDLLKIYNSKSWKLTNPLRKFAKKIRKFKKIFNRIFS